MDDFIAFARRSGLWQLGDDSDLERFAVQDYRRFWQLLLGWSELLAEGVDEPRVMAIQSSMRCSFRTSGSAMPRIF